MRIDILTLFPEMLQPAIAGSILGRASEAGLATFHITNPRDFANDKHRTCDDRPFGGGAGMVMKAEPLADALDDVLRRGREEGLVEPYVIFFSPQGTVFNQAEAQRYSAYPWLIFVCGRYEGIDQRVIDLYADEELSIGDFVLTGGEVAAWVVSDAVVRLIPGALGHPDSAIEDSFSAGRDGLLDCPHYTRPEVFRELRVPDVLMSGHHARITAWRKQQSRERTAKRRPDLM